METQLEETLKEVGKRCKRDFLPRRKPTQHLLRTKMEVFPFTFLLGNREKWERGMIQEVWGEEVGGGLFCQKRRNTAELEKIQ